MTDIDKMTCSQLITVLEAKITHTIRTAKRTKNFKMYLDLLNAAYVHSTGLNELMKVADKMAVENDGL